MRYEPIISDCEMILSKKLSSKESRESREGPREGATRTHFKPLTENDLKASVIQSSDSRGDLKKTKVVRRKSKSRSKDGKDDKDKENDLW